MKKLISLALALMLVFSLATVAMAATQNPDGSYVDESTITITKTYDATNTDSTSPAETFTFSTPICTSVANAGVDPTTGAVVTTSTAPVPTIGSVTYAAGDAGKTTAMTKTITITLPSYSAVGIYTYTFTENEGTTAGVTYFGDTITLVVTVIQDGEGRTRIAAVHTEANPVANGQNKSDEFVNTYSAGKLDITKEVTGDFGDRQKDFTVTVTFTAPQGRNVNEAISYSDDGENKTIAGGWTGSKQVTIDLKHEETVTFKNIPYGVTYTVDEDSYAADGYDAAAYSVNNGTSVASVINEELNDASETVKITNNKGGTIDTGITLDSLPFVLILAVCAGAVVLFVIKRRRSVDF